MGLGNAELKLVHAIAGTLLGVQGLVHQKKAEIAAWSTVSFRAHLYVPFVFKEQKQTNPNQKPQQFDIDSLVKCDFIYPRSG